MKNKRVLSVGDCVADILLSPLPDLPAEDMQKNLDWIQLSPGGNSLNFALASAALGADTEFLGLTGSDQFSDFLRKFMSSTGVKDKTKQDPDNKTATTIAIPSEKGGRRLLTYSGTNRYFSVDPESIDMRNLFHLHRGGYWFTLEMIGEPTRALFERAKDNGVETSIDPATDPRGWNESRISGLMECISFTDILFINEHEAVSISGKRSVEDACNFLVENGAGKVLLHKGEEGITEYLPDRPPASFPAVPIKQVKNPTGAGDVFNGAYIAARSLGFDDHKAIKLGIAASHLHIISAEPLYPDMKMTRSVVESKR